MNCKFYKKRAAILVYSIPLSPSSSGPGRRPFKAKITGSNPVGGTIDCSTRLQHGAGFFVTQRPPSQCPPPRRMRQSIRTQEQRHVRTRRHRTRRCFIHSRADRPIRGPLHRSTRRTARRRRWEPASSRQPQPPPWHPRLHADAPWPERPRVHSTVPAADRP